MALFASLKIHGWKYSSLICFERKTLFFCWNNTTHKTSEQDQSEQRWKTILYYILKNAINVTMCSTLHFTKVYIMTTWWEKNEMRMHACRRGCCVPAADPSCTDWPSDHTCAMTCRRVRAWVRVVPGSNASKLPIIRLGRLSHVRTRGASVHAPMERP